MRGLCEYNRKPRGGEVAARDPTDQKPSMLHPAGGREEGEEDEEEAAPAAAVMERREWGGRFLLNEERTS